MQSQSHTSAVIFFKFSKLSENKKCICCYLMQVVGYQPLMDTVWPFFPPSPPHFSKIALTQFNIKQLKNRGTIFYEIFGGRENKGGKPQIFLANQTLTDLSQGEKKCCISILTLLLNGLLSLNNCNKKCSLQLQKNCPSYCKIRANIILCIF